MGNLERTELYRWQKHFCDMANIFVCCVDGNNNPLTELGGNEADKELLRKVIDYEQFRSMLQRVSESTLEEQAIEATAYPNLRLAVISAKAAGKPVLSWLVCGVLSDAADVEDYDEEPLSGFTSTLSGKQFEAAVDALHDITVSLSAWKLELEAAKAETIKSRKSELEMEEKLKRAETLTEMVRLLDSEASIERIMKKLLHLPVIFLRLGVGAVYKSLEEESGGEGPVFGLEVLASWVRAGTAWQAREEYDPECRDFFRTKKTLVLSLSSRPKLAEKKVLEQLGMTAVVIVPVKINGVIERYVYFGQTFGEHIWGLEDVKLIKEAAKILQSILNRRVY